MVDKTKSSSSSIGEGPSGFPAEDYVAFHGELLAARNRFAEVFKGIELPSPISEDDAKYRQKEGMPLIPLGLTLPSQEDLLQALSEFVEIAEKHKVLEAEEIIKVRAALEQPALKRLIDAAAAGEPEKIRDLGDELNVASDSLLFIGENFARAVLKHYAEPLRELFDSQVAARNGTCPVCGNAPRLSSIGGEEGDRSLMCGMCETTWKFKRVGCPHCGNEEQKKLRHFTVGKEPNFRVGVCENCKRYLKQVDLRKLRGESVVLADLDVASARLDLLAWREGYR